VSADGGCNWTAGIPACNAVVSAASNFSDSISRGAVFVLRTHAGKDACGPVATAACFKNGT